MTNPFQPRYYKISILLLSLFGLWPYQDRARRCALFAIFMFMVVSIFIPTVIAAVEYGDDVDIFMESIQTLGIIVSCLVKVLNIFCNSDKMLNLAERIKFDWMSLAYQPEMHELQRYAEVGRQFSIAYVVAMFTTYVVYMTQPVVPQILIAFNFTGESQTKKLPFPTDYYGIDSESYYYYMLVHSYICSALVATSIVAADTMYIMQVQHACGMFTVVGLQLQRIGDVVPERSRELHPQPAKKDQSFQQMTACLKRHGEVIKFANMLENSYNCSFLILLVVSTMLISIIGFQGIMKLNDSIYEAMKCAAFVLTEMIALFFHALFAQKLIDRSEQIRDHMSQVKWYQMSLSMQKVTSIVIMRTYIPCQITAGKLIILSLENFTSVVKASISFFTLLRSRQ